MGDHDDRLVAHRVPIAVVEPLEPVDIEQDDADRLAPRARLRQRQPRPIEKIAAIAGPGQRIGFGHGHQRGACLGKLVKQRQHGGTDWGRDQQGRDGRNIEPFLDRNMGHEDGIGEPGHQHRDNHRKRGNGCYDTEFSHAQHPCVEPRLHLPPVECHELSSPFHPDSLRLSGR
jgi:hypothetical protein